MHIYIYLFTIECSKRFSEFRGPHQISSKSPKILQTSGSSEYWTSAKVSKIHSISLKYTLKQHTCNNINLKHRDSRNNIEIIAIAPKLSILMSFYHKEIHRLPWQHGATALVCTDDLAPQDGLPVPLQAWQHGEVRPQVAGQFRGRLAHFSCIPIITSDVNETLFIPLTLNAPFLHFV